MNDTTRSYSATGADFSYKQIAEIEAQEEARDSSGLASSNQYYVSIMGRGWDAVFEILETVTARREQIRKHNERMAEWMRK